MKVTLFSVSREFIKTPEQGLYCSVVLRAIEDIKYYMEEYLTPDITPEFLYDYLANAYCSKEALKVYRKLQEVAIENKIVDYSSKALAYEMSMGTKFFQSRITELKKQGLLESEFIFVGKIKTFSRYSQTLYLKDRPIVEINPRNKKQKTFSVTEREFTSAVKYLFHQPKHHYFSLEEHLNYVMDDDIEIFYAIERVRKSAIFYLKKDLRVLYYFQKKYRNTLTDTLIEKAIEALI